MSKYHLEEPLFRSSCDTISWILQSINEGAEVTLKAAFAAAIFQRLPRRVYVEQEKEPLQILLNTTVDLDKKLVWIAEMKTEVVNEGQLVSERLRTLREWICVYPYRTLFESNAAARTAPYMHSHIAAPDGPYDLRRFHMVGLGTMGFALLNMYNELGMGTTNYSPHVFAMCYLVVGLKHSKRTTGTWATIEAVSDRHRKDIFISEDLPSKISDMVTRMRLASGASLAHIASMMRAQFTGRKVTSIDSASTVRTWDITCSPIVSILRRYLSDEESLLRTVYALDSEIQKETGTRSSFIQLGTVPFLAALQTSLEFASMELKTDYMTLDSVCRVLFQKMEAMLGASRLGPMDPNDAWTTHTTRSYTMVLDVLGELENVEGIRARIGNPSLKVPTPLADIAQEILSAYVRDGAVGIPK
jgi:hypothetical protein